MLASTVAVPHAAFPMVMTSASTNVRINENGFFLGGRALSLSGAVSVELTSSMVRVVTPDRAAGSAPPVSLVSRSPRREREQVRERVRARARARVRGRGRARERERDAGAGARARAGAAVHARSPLESNATLPSQ